eukprot:scaffold195707_cov30-Tisochrysis_lutea.AAC.3
MRTSGYPEPSGGWLAFAALVPLLLHMLRSIPPVKLHEGARVRIYLDKRWKRAGDPSSHFVVSQVAPAWGKQRWRALGSGWGISERSTA